MISALWIPFTALIERARVTYLLLSQSARDGDCKKVVTAIFRLAGIDGKIWFGFFYFGGLVHFPASLGPCPGQVKWRNSKNIN